MDEKLNNIEKSLAEIEVDVKELVRRER